MNETKLFLLQLILEGNVDESDSFRVIGKKLTDKSRKKVDGQTVKHHLASLVLCGFVKYEGGNIAPTEDGKELVKLLKENKELFKKIFKLAGRSH